MSDGVVSLEQLDSASESGVAVVLFDRHHVRVEIRVSVAVSGNRHGVADEHVTVPRANQLAADFRSERENAQGNKFCVTEAPDFLLQGNTLAKFLEGRAVAKHEGFYSHSFPCCLDSCHSVSISSSDAS